MEWVYSTPVHLRTHMRECVEVKLDTPNPNRFTSKYMHNLPLHRSYAATLPDNICINTQNKDPVSLLKQAVNSIS